MADPRDELTLADMANDPNILRLTVRPEGVVAPPPSLTGWGSSGAGGRPSGRLFEPDLAQSPTETAFQQGIRATPWFSEFKAKHGEEPNLDDPNYDYRKAWAAGSRPTVRDPGDQMLHWSSEFKGAEHPNRYVNGVDTITGQPAQRPTIGERIGLRPVDWWPSPTETGAALGRGIGGLVQGAGTALSGMSRPPSDLTGGSRLSPGAGPPSSISGLPPRRAPVAQPPGGFFGTTVNKALDEIQQLGEAQQVQFSPGATPEQRTQAREAGPGLAANITMNVAGTGVTAASIRGGTSLGVFGGRIEPGRKAYAERLEAAGKTPDEIWKEVGVVRFADKQWRQEIPDIAASYRGDADSIASRIFDQKYPEQAGRYRRDQADLRSQDAKTSALLKIQQGALVLPDVIPHHPQLYTLYPELRHMPVSHDAFMQASGGYLARHKDTPHGKIIYREEPEASGKVTPRGITFRTLIHEIDHAIANIEGFAKGSNSLASNTLILGHPAQKFFEKMAAQAPNATPQELRQMRERAGHAAYNASAGEKSALVAEHRVDFTPEQLAAINPTSMMRPRMDKQIVEFNKPFDPAQQQAQMGGVLSPTPREMQMSGPSGLMPPKSQRKAQGSLNPLDEMDVTWKGKPMAEWKPQDWKEVGDHYGVKNLGPLSKVEKYISPDGYVFEIPGGTKGTWTYYDLLHMKANPINPNNLPHELHAEMQKKLGRTMTPHGEVGQDQIWNGMMFGMTSASNPLFPNQLSASRLRLRDPKMLDALAKAVPWEPGATHTRTGELITKEMRAEHDHAIGQMMGLHAAPGGLGTRGGLNYTYIAELAQMFQKNPEWFRKKASEDWTSFVERLASQTKGLSMKTGSFSSVWQDPFHAAISAIDRHMVKEFERRGGLFKDAAEQNAWQEKTRKTWNKERPDQTVETWQDMVKQRGFDGFMSEKLLEYVGAHGGPAFRNVKGEINPNLPEHVRKQKWVQEPKQVVQAGEAYRRALAENQKAANEQGLNLFMSQWFEWDRIRQRFEPHENMFPGLSQMPAPSKRQLEIPFAAHAETGHTNYEKGPTGRMHPTNKFPRNPSELGYLGVPLAAGGAAGIGSVVRPDQYQPEGR